MLCCFNLTLHTDMTFRNVARLSGLRKRLVYTVNNYLIEFFVSGRHYVAGCTELN